MNSSDKITILLNTCDKYEDIWPIFFEVLEKQFDGVDKYNFVLNTEKKCFKYKNYDIKCYNFFNDNNYCATWSKRYYDTLSKIDTEYVFPILEDYFFESKVDTGYFEKCINIMDEDKDIDVIYFRPYENMHKHYYIDDKKYDRLVLLPKIVNYKLTTDVSIWRRKSLMSYIDLRESPWEFEVYGTYRSWKSDKKFYSMKPNAKMVFDVNPHKLGISEGKWKNKKLTIEYFRKMGIDVNFEKRGFTDWYYSVKNNFFRDVLKKKWWKVFFNKIVNIKQVLAVKIMYLCEDIYMKMHKEIIGTNFNDYSILEE